VSFEVNLSQSLSVFSDGINAWSFFHLAQYSDRLASVMNKILLISQIATLSRDIERYESIQRHNKKEESSEMKPSQLLGLSAESLDGLLNSTQQEEASIGFGELSNYQFDSVDPGLSLHYAQISCRCGL